MVLTREEEVKTYQLFDRLIPGGMKTGWIHEHKDQEQYSKGYLYGLHNDEGWTQLFVCVDEMTPAMEDAWEAQKNSVGAEPFLEFLNNNSFILGFRVHAHQLQQLPPEVEPDLLPGKEESEEQV